MKGYGLLAAVVAFALWTAGVAYFADQHGYGRAEENCQEERDEAARLKREEEAKHAERARELSDDLAAERTRASGLRTTLDRLRGVDPVDCRAGAARLQLWNEANSGGPVSGIPPDPVR